MRLHDSLTDILATKARLAVLRILVRIPRKEFTGRELARHSQVSLAQAQAALETLRRAGIVERRSVGRSHQWRVVRDNVLWAHLRDLFRAEQSILTSLEEEVRKGLANVSVRRVRIFGSVASAREQLDSDVDLYIELDGEAGVRRVEQALSSLAPRIGRRFGVRLNPVVVALSKRKNLNPNVLRDVEGNGLSVIPMVIRGP